MKKFIFFFAAFVAVVLPSKSSAQNDASFRACKELCHRTVKLEMKLKYSPIKGKLVSFRINRLLSKSNRQIQNVMKYSSPYKQFVCIEKSANAMKKAEYLYARTRGDVMYF